MAGVTIASRGPNSGFFLHILAIQPQTSTPQHNTISTVSALRIPSILSYPPTTSSHLLNSRTIPHIFNRACRNSKSTSPRHTPIHHRLAPCSHRRHCFPHSLRLPPSHFPHSRSSTNQIWLLVPPLINLTLSAHLPTRTLCRGGRNGGPRRRPSATLFRHHHPRTGAPSTGDRGKDPCFCD
jgi:hypothetical protein